MLKDTLTRKCDCNRLPATWLCTFPNCKRTFFCKKCRKYHDRKHEKNSYPILELLEDDGDIPNENNELSTQEKKKIYQKLDDEIERAQDRFERDMKKIRKLLRENIDKYHLKQSLNYNIQNLQECRKKVLENPNDNELLKNLGTEYHNYMHESNFYNIDKEGMIKKLNKDIDHRFDYFNFDLDKIISYLGNSSKYPEKLMINKINTKRKSSFKEEEKSMSSNRVVRNERRKSFTYSNKDLTDPSKPTEEKYFDIQIKENTNQSLSKEKETMNENNPKDPE
jgi:DNA-binding PadR family transcriptional regulator